MGTHTNPEGHPTIVGVPASTGAKPIALPLNEFDEEGEGVGVAAGSVHFVADGVITFVTVPPPEYESVREDSEPVQTSATTSLEMSEERS